MRDNLAVPDLDHCAREPIAYLDHVQSFGFLIALTNDWTIVRASANLHDFLGTEAAQAIGIDVTPAFHPAATRDRPLFEGPPVSHPTCG